MGECQADQRPGQLVDQAGERALVTPPQRRDELGVIWCRRHRAEAIGPGEGRIGAMDALISVCESNTSRGGRTSRRQDCRTATRDRFGPPAQSVRARPQRNHTSGCSGTAAPDPSRRLRRRASGSERRGRLDGGGRRLRRRRGRSAIAARPSSGTCSRQRRSTGTRERAGCRRTQAASRRAHPSRPLAGTARHDPAPRDRRHHPHSHAHRPPRGWSRRASSVARFAKPSSVGYPSSRMRTSAIVRRASWKALSCASAADTGCPSQK